MKTALMVIATGPKYHKYAENLIESAKKYFVPHDVVIFSEKPWTSDNVQWSIPYNHFGYPNASYYRYRAFAEAYKVLSGYDQLFFSDCDMLFVAPVSGDEIFSDGITATEHPGYVGLPGTPETNPVSMAYCPKVRTYFCGGFNGGKSEAFLNMSRDLARDIDIDDIRGHRAVWVDESFLNRYLFDNPPAKILTPSFCYPEKDEYYKGIWAQAKRGPFEPKLLALEKGGR